jgi:dTDP-glucose 4,6-dehydratase
MKRILLTGAGGAIGVHVLAHIMHNTDWFVVATDSFKTEHKGYHDRITRVCRNHPEWLPRIKIITHDLISPFTERQIRDIGEIDYIINLASRSDVQTSIIDPLPFVRNNTEIMLSVLELARELTKWKDCWDEKCEEYGGKPNGSHSHPGPLKLFLHFSTDEVYGSCAKDSGGHKEWSPILPSNPYSASKAAQEALAIAWWRSYGLPLIITNTMNNFGEMQAPSKFPAMIQQKIEKGETIKVHATKDGQIGTRYYLHSRNAADAIIFILKNIQPIIHKDGESDMPVRLNIVGDKQVSNLELVQTIAKLMDKEASYELTYFHEDNPGHDLHYGLNGDKLAELGWKSPISFEESMENTIKWQQRNPEWMLLI